MQKRLKIVNHTHWDRELYESFETMQEYLEQRIWKCRWRVKG